MQRNVDASRLERSCGDLATLRDSPPATTAASALTPRQPRTITAPAPRFVLPASQLGATFQAGSSNSSSFRFSGTNSLLSPQTPTSTTLAPSYAHSGSVPSFVLVAGGGAQSQPPPVPPPPPYVAPRLPLVGGYRVPMPAPPPLPRGPPPPSPPRIEVAACDGGSEDDDGGTLTRRSSADGDLATAGKRFSSCPNLLDELPQQFALRGLPSNVNLRMNQVRQAYCVHLNAN